MFWNCQSTSFKIITATRVKKTQSRANQQRKTRKENKILKIPKSKSKTNLIPLNSCVVCSYNPSTYNSVLPDVFEPDISPYFSGPTNPKLASLTSMKRHRHSKLRQDETRWGWFYWNLVSNNVWFSAISASMHS